METEKVTMLRYRGTKVSKIKNIDMFPKVKEVYKETSSVGGTFSLVSFIIILWLVYSEVTYYLESNFVFKFSPDTDFDSTLTINLDITVAMPCGTMGTDILDSTNQNAMKFGQLDEEDTWFEMTQNQMIHFQNKKHLNSYLREEYHAIHELLWKSSFMASFHSNDIPKREQDPDRPYDACRIHGSLELNKVAGNLHMTAGKSINFPRGHIHIAAFMSERDYNFSHRINVFSFGDSSPGIIHPLEGDEIISDYSMTQYNYFIEVVPTNVKTFLKSYNTYQYSVKSIKRPINHSKGTHGMPGIYFKYDVSALKVTVRQERDSFAMFLVRLCSIVAGIYVCSGFLNSIVQHIYKFVTCTWIKQNGDLEEKTFLISPENNLPPIISPILQNKPM